MAGNQLDVEHLLHPDQLACQISQQWVEWNTARNSKIEEWKELRNYLYATSTSTTSNALLPWSNTTTIPKLTQIADNLHANYMAALFPRREWFRWVVEGRTEDKEQKRKAIESYMRAKLRGSKFKDTTSLLILDYILYGNCFATVDWVSKYTMKTTGVTKNYTGPRLVRVSPFDIVFNPIADSFENSPKIIRSIKTIGELKKMTQDDPTLDVEGVFDRIIQNRHAIGAEGERTNLAKSEGFVADGFSDIRKYYGSGYVEIFTFYGDFYDMEANEYHTDRVVTVVDRAYVVQNIESPSWLGSAPIFHAGWRQRPDNLWAMGPLDNLVGMQYRLDHLENLKADVFDQIAVPMIKIKGTVEDFDFAPGERVYLGEEGDIQAFVPDATALNADFQIEAIERRMEEMAGAPRSAMGVRTPGEKTAFEVSSLQTSANRIFEHKTAHFESVFEEPALNAMLEAGRRNMSTVETVAIFDETAGQEFFEEVTKADLNAEGSLYPLGARHFAERARRVQNFNQLFQIKSSDPSVSVHMSGKEMARLITEELGEETLFGENIGLTEQMETMEAQQELEVSNQESLAIKEENGV